MSKSKTVERKRIEGLYHSRYRSGSLHSGLDGVCHYCGARAAARDHCPPLRVVDADPDAEFEEYLLIPSCTRCNSKLGDKWSDGFEYRRNILRIMVEQEMLARRHKGLSNAVVTEEDLEGMGRNLRGYIRDSECKGNRWRSNVLTFSIEMELAEYLRELDKARSEV